MPTAGSLHMYPDAPDPITKAACLNIIHCCTDARFQLLKGITVVLADRQNCLFHYLFHYLCFLQTWPPAEWWWAIINKHKKQTYRIACLSAPAPSHSAPAVPLAGSDSCRAHSPTRQSGGGTVPCWWTSSESWWSSWAASPSDGAHR